jgi:hypothetical protein
MTDYRIVHVQIPMDDGGVATAARVERECDNAAREGWYLHSVIPEMMEGTTRGMWLVFAAAEDEGHADAPAVAVANEILHAGDAESRPTGA